MFIKTGDTVKVISGKGKGAEGSVLSTLPKEDKVTVEGVNIVKKHTRPQMGLEGGIVEKEAPIHVSNVQIVDPESGETTRVGFKFEDGKKVRYSKKSGENI